MSEENKKLGAAIAQALEILPEHKKEYILGFVEGAAAMTTPRDEQSTEPVSA